MKKLIWGKTLFESYKYIKRLVNSLDRIIYEKSVNSYGMSIDGKNTIESMEAVIDLIQRKKRLLLIKMIVEEGLKNIDRHDAKILIRYYLDKIELKTIADQEGKTTRTMSRLVDKMILSFMDKMSDLGYSYVKIEKMLENEGWIVGVFNSHIRKNASGSTKVEPLIVPASSKFDKLLYAYCVSK